MATNLCPHCGYRSQIAPISAEEGAIEVRGRFDGCSVIACLRCGNGMLRGLWSVKPIPPGIWSVMSQVQQNDLANSRDPALLADWTAQSAALRKVRPLNLYEIISLVVAVATLAFVHNADPTWLIGLWAAMFAVRFVQQRFTDLQPTQSMFGCLFDLVRWGLWLYLLFNALS